MKKIKAEYVDLGETFTCLNCNLTFNYKKAPKDKICDICKYIKAAEDESNQTRLDEFK